MQNRMPFSSFSEVESYLEQFTYTTRVADRKCRVSRLERMHRILDRLGNPQNSYRTIHVAGSKGKGSTATFIARGLEGSGFRTGLYMSPHVTDCRERFTLCGRFFDDTLLISTAEQMRDALDGIAFPEEFGEPVPTTFEMYTAYAFLLFKNAGCQWAVIETGMGGRLDATNVLMPEASVLTPIELEHTEILGDTIALIATEKSKIIKPARPVFVSMQTEDARRVFEEEAKANGSPISFLGDMVSDLRASSTCEGQEVSYAFSDGTKLDVRLSMPGLVQAQNCALAIVTLRGLGLLTEGSIEAMEGTLITGRMERIRLERTMFLDGAHTENSMRQACETFRTMYPGKGGVCIFGSVAGKHHAEMARTVLDAFDRVVIARPGTFKKSDVDALYGLFREMARPDQRIELRPLPQDAWDAAVGMCEPDQAVLVCGSFYLCGAIKETLCR